MSTQPGDRGRHAFAGLRSGFYNGRVGLFAVVLTVCALLVVLGAEWPRIARRVGVEARQTRLRRRRKERFTVIDGERDDDFAESVERDLANLPVTEELDGRSRR